jgi:hypothetical protein
VIGNKIETAMERGTARLTTTTGKLKSHVSRDGELTDGFTEECLCLEKAPRPEYLQERTDASVQKEMEKSARSRIEVT